jgi:hypothetical protein
LGVNQTSLLPEGGLLFFDGKERALDQVFSKEQMKVEMVDGCTSSDGVVADSE